MIVVHTQFLENYGAHAESGKFSDDNHYWKFKGGTTYVVDDLYSEADAVAFVMAAFSENSLGYKEYPSTTQSYDEWLDTIIGRGYEDSAGTFYKRTALYVSPKTGTKTMSYSEWEDMMNAENEMTANQYEYDLAYDEMEEVYGS
jgi:hypothetical protein